MRERAFSLRLMSSFILCEGAMGYDKNTSRAVNKKGLSKKPIKKRRQRKIVKKVKEDLSKRDIEELMGIRRPTYRRNRGAFRQS